MVDHGDHGHTFEEQHDMEDHGLPCYFMVITMVFHGLPWFRTMVFHVLTWSEPWFSMVYHGENVLFFTSETQCKFMKVLSLINLGLLVFSNK